MVIYAAGPAFDANARLHAAIGLLQQGRLEEAWRPISEVLQAEADNALAYQLRGLILAQVGRMPAAADDFRRAVELNPADPAAHNNLANALRDLGRCAESLQACDRALALAPDFLDAVFSRANALLDLGRPDEALAGYDRVLARQPALAKAHSNKGLALRSLNRADLAVDSFERALALEPGRPEIRANAGCAYLAKGELEKGFALFEARWSTPVMAAYLASRAFEAPLWRGEAPIEGRTLLLHSEQGYGDIFQFCRYAALAAERGARVVLEVQAPAVALMRTLKGVDLVVEHGQPLPAYDLHCPVMSLPHAFRTTLDTIPGQAPYLFADPAKAAAWRGRLGPRARPRVGLAWSSGVRPDQPELAAANGRRDLPFDKLKAFAGLAVDFVSLQKGAPAEAAFEALDPTAWDGPPIANVAFEIKDWSDTAALIDTLDLVVSVDTATPHLAGAMGRPVWIMNRFDPCWRWLETRTDSPWYPTARLFRQPTPGDWDSVVAKVRGALGAEFGA